MQHGKPFERRVAKYFPGGVRRGADTRGEHAGKSDIIAPGWAPECKLLKRPAYSDLLRAARQAEANCKLGDVPVAIVKRKHDHDADALVVFRLETFARCDGFLLATAEEKEKQCGES